MRSAGPREVDTTDIDGGVGPPPPVMSTCGPVPTNCVRSVLFHAKTSVSPPPPESRGSESVTYLFVPLGVPSVPASAAFSSVVGSKLDTATASLADVTALLAIVAATEPEPDAVTSPVNAVIPPPDGSAGAHSLPPHVSTSLSAGVPTTTAYGFVTLGAPPVPASAAFSWAVGSNPATPTLSKGAVIAPSAI